MKVIITAALSALFGAVLGSLVMQIDRVHAATAGRIETKDLILLDEHDKPAARLTSMNGRSTLTFYGSDSRPALSLGVKTFDQTRFLRFFGRDGRVLAALNSLPPNGETTLYLGDERSAARITIGALQTDMPGEVNDWGLMLRKPGSQESLFNLIVKSSGKSLESSVGMRLVRKNGEVWSIF